jgi:hypothetical protein
MRALALALIVGGWMIAVGGLLASESMASRMPAALVGFATSLGGIFTLNRTYVENALWKTRGR